MPKPKLTETLRFRTDPRIRRRVDAVAEKRGCDPSDILREAALTFVAAEEKRLGIAEGKAA